MKAPSKRAKEQALQALMERLGYQFTNRDLLHLALSHRSLGPNNNERLEFLGDSIVNFVIAEALYRQFPKAKEGQMSRLRAGLVKGVTLAEVGKELQVGECLRLGTGERKSGGQRRESILADAVESIIGAIYLDSDIETCEARILAWFDARLRTLDWQTNQKDAKTRLQEFLQARKQELPVYELLQVKGNDHEQIFVMSCQVDMLDVATQAEASSRRIGEQKAAALALQMLEQHVAQENV
jgi:ribonuclease-3